LIPSVPAFPKLVYLATQKDEQLIRKLRSAKVPSQPRSKDNEEQCKLRLMTRNSNGKEKQLQEKAMARKSNCNVG
jgi:hypothetical protein